MDVCVLKKVIMEEIIITDRQMFPQASRIHACYMLHIRFPLFNGIESKRELLLLLLQLTDIQNGLYCSPSLKENHQPSSTTPPPEYDYLSFYSAYILLYTTCINIKWEGAR